MGIKIQSKTFLPGCYSKMDLNNAGNGTWTMYDTDRSLNNGLFNDAFAASLSVNKYIGCEKERVKQTILKHESEFRNQLQELHRLYRKQKDLMHDLERREFHKHPSPAEKSKSIVLLSEAPECENNTSHGSNFLMACSTFGSAASGADTSQPHSSIIKGKSQCSLLSFNGRAHLEDSEYLKPKCDKFMKKMLDLELPADVYADDEGKQQDGALCGVKGIEISPVERNKKAASRRNVNLLADSSLNGASKGDALRPKTYLKIHHNLADLNEPIRMEGTSITESVNNVVSSTCLRNGTEKWNAYSSSSSDSCFWSVGLSQSCLDGKNSKIIVNNRHAESDRNGNGWLAYDPKAGKSRCNEYTSFGGIIGEHPSTLFRPLQVEPKESPELKFTLSDQCNSAAKNKTTIFGVELTEGTNNRSGGDTSCTPSLHPLNQQSDVMNSEPTCIAPWRKTSNALVQNVVSFQDNHDLRTSASFTGNNLRSIISSKPEVSHKNGLCYGSQSVSKQVQGCLDLNSYVVNPHGSLTTLVQLQNSASSDIEKRCSGEQIKVKEIIYQMNLDSLQNHSQHFFGKAKLTKTPLEDSTSPTRCIESGSRRVDEGDLKSSTEGLGKCIDNVPTHHASTRNRDGTPKDLTCNCEIVNKLETKDSIVDNGLQNYLSGFRYKIDLNLPLDEEEIPSAPSLPVAIVKIATTEINLEAPSVLESDKDDVNDEAEHLVEKNDLCSKGSVDDSNDQHVEHARLAAEVIIDISLSKSDAIDPPNQFVESLPTDCLLLLADVISSCGHESKLTKGLTTGNEVSDEETVPEGMDYFEFMTLKLQNNKEEGYSYKQCVVEEWNDEENGGSSIPKRPRKGQAKRRKDFQRDILPSMVSLSRREVSEDLQSIEEMFKAKGHTWESRLLRRRAGNGRGRRRLAPPQTQIAISPPPPVQEQQQQQQASHREVELVDRNLTGWGKRTRRLPRQRCSITNNFTPPALKC